MRKKNRTGLIRQYAFPVALVFACLNLPACSGENKQALYAQYNKLCNIIEVNYNKFENTGHTSGDVVRLYSGLEKDINKEITSNQIRKTFFLLFNTGLDDPYAIFKQDIKKRTGENYTCEAFVKLTRIQVKKDK